LWLQGFKTLLTDSEDASFLFNAVLDAVVDHTMPVVQVRRVIIMAAVDMVPVVLGLHGLERYAKLVVPSTSLFNKHQSFIIWDACQWCI
jgi:hypothetical protein